MEGKNKRIGVGVKRKKETSEAVYTHSRDEFSTPFVL